MFERLLNRVRRDMVSMHTDIIKRNTEPLKHSLTVPIVQVSVHHLSRHLIAISFLVKRWLGSLDYYCLSSSYHQLIVVEPPFCQCRWRRDDDHYAVLVGTRYGRISRSTEACTS